MSGAVFYGDCLYLLGGLKEDSTASNELYSLDFETWEWALVNTFTCEGKSMPMAGHSVTLHGEELLVFGGSDLASVLYSNLFVYQIPENKWNKVNCELLPRFCGGMCVAGSKIWLVGGCNLERRENLGEQELDLSTLSSKEPLS